MSAAAAGASCRNARKRQAQQIIKDKAEAAKKLKEKLEAAKAAELSAHPKSKQFHQLPPNYLRAPPAQGRKLSVGYTGHGSKLLLPISEQSAQHHSPSQQTLHHHQRHQHHYTNEPRTPTFGHRELRLDGKLTKSATATFPLISHAGTPPASPGICFRQHQQFFKDNPSNLLSAQHQLNIQVARNDGIIITPATPLPSPSPSTNHLKQQEDRNLTVDRGSDERVNANADDLPEFPLERTCSVYRNRKLEANEKTTINIADMDEEQQQQQFYPGGMPNGNGGHHTHWADEFYDAESRTMGVCTCDHVEVNLMSFVEPLFGLKCNFHSEYDIH